MTAAAYSSDSTREKTTFIMTIGTTTIRTDITTRIFTETTIT